MGSFGGPKAPDIAPPPPPDPVVTEEELNVTANKASIRESKRRGRGKMRKDLGTGLVIPTEAGLNS